MATVSYEDLRFPVYLNSRGIGTVGGTPLTVSDAINAAQISKLNVFLAGKKGVGKTQLLRDIYMNRYGGKGTNFEGRPDLKPDEVFKLINLEKLREAKSTSEVVELAQAINYHFIGVDELNRCPEITQNQLLSLMNGYVLHQGKPVKLGTGFCAGVATGNLGNGGYVGTFRIDEALQDRLHLFLDLDYFKPTDADMAELDSRTDLDPRIVDAKSRDISDKIIETNKALSEIKPSLEMTIIGRYLERAMDYCSKFDSAGNSKDNLGGTWPAICTQKSCELRDTLCGKVKSVSERTVKAVKNLGRGLQYVAKLKNAETVADPLGSMLVATRLVLPYSGVISPNYLREEGMFNNANLASDKLIEQIQKDLYDQIGVGGRAGPLTLAIAHAIKGQFDKHPYNPKDKKWGFAAHMLKQLSDMYKAGKKE